MRRPDNRPLRHAARWRSSRSETCKSACAGSWGRVNQVRMLPPADSTSSILSCSPPSRARGWSISDSRAPWSRSRSPLFHAASSVRARYWEGVRDGFRCMILSPVYLKQTPYRERGSTIDVVSFREWAQSSTAPRSIREALKPMTRRKPADDPRLMKFFHKKV